MTFLPLSLSLRQASDVGTSRDALEKTLRRDDYACRFCGFRSKKYQRVVPWIHERDSLPLVTACSFCEQCLSLERAGMMGTGVLIWLPEIGQAELNHIARAIYVARAGADEPMAAAATQAFDLLMGRRAEAKKRLGSDDPLLLATILRENLTADEALQASVKLEGLRLMPLDKHLVRGDKGDVNQFPEIVKYWCSAGGPYASLPVGEWAEMFKRAVG